MESKKTVGNQKQGWDAKNQVLIDNFGNIYDFGNKKVNGVQCKQLDNSTILKLKQGGGIQEILQDISFESKAGMIPIKINGYTLFLSNCPSLEMNNKYYVESLLGFSERNVNMEIKDSNNTTLLTAPKDITIDFTYGQQGKCNTMNFKYQQFNNVITGENQLHDEIWFKDGIFTYNHNTNKTTCFRKQPDNTYKKTRFTCDSKLLDIYDKNNDILFLYAKGPEGYEIDIYDKKYDEIAERILLGENFVPFDNNFRSYCFEYKGNNEDLSEKITTFLKSTKAKYNMNTPSNRGPYRGG